MAVERNQQSIIDALLGRRNTEQKPEQAFVWGPGGQRLTPDQIERYQKMAEKQMLAGGDYSPIQHWTQGGARVMSALAGVMRENRAANAATANANASAANITAMLSGLNQQTPQGPSVVPYSPPQTQTSPQAPTQTAQPFQNPPDAVKPQQSFTPPMQTEPSPFTTPEGSVKPEQSFQPVAQNVMELSPDDLKRLQKLVLTEAVHGLPDEAYNQQVGGIVDTALNRVRSGLWGKDVRSVLNAPYQFSDINGPVSWKRGGRKDVDQIPDSWLNTPNGKRVMAALDAHIQNRGSNQPIIGGHLNYANPHYSDKSNLGWINKLDGPKLGAGTAIHHHGTAGNNKPVDPNYFLRVQGQPGPTAQANVGLVAPGMDQIDPELAASLQASAGATMPQTAPQQAAERPPLFLGDSHSAALARFGNGQNMGVNGAHIPAILQQLQNAPQNSRVFMSAGTNDAVGNWSEQTIRQQVAQAAEIAKQRGINLTWAGPTGPKGATLDAILADATKANGINYRSMQGQNFAMQPDGIHAQINPNGYGAMWNALNQQPQTPQQPVQVASLGPTELPAQEPPQQAPQQQLAQAPFSMNDVSAGNAMLAQRPQAQPIMPQQQPQVAPQAPAPQAQAPAPQPAPQARPQINPRIIQSLTNPYASPQERSIASALIQQHMTANQPKYETKVLPNGDVVMINERDPNAQSRVVHSAPKWQYGVIRKDQFGRDVYGFINPNSQQAIENEGKVQQPQGPSVIPPVPNGVDPKVWMEKHSLRQTEQALGPTDETVTKMRGEIRDLPSYKNMAVVGPAYNRMVKSAANDNRASDLSLVYTFMKMLDPGSVVRESEVSMAQNVPTLPEQYRNSIMSFVTGSGRLDPKVREQLVQEAKIAAQSYRSAWDNDLKLYQGIMGRRKINPEDVYSDFEPFQEFTPPAQVAPPPNMDPKVWEFLTPEERKLWQKK